MAGQERRTIDLEEGWAVMQKGITKLKNILEGKPEPQFSSEDYMMLYTTIYNMCTQKPPHDYSQQLYNKYRESFEEYITSMKVQNESLAQYATPLLEKEHSGCSALLRDDTVEDLSRMYRLFSKITRGLEPISNMFKTHVTNEGAALVKQAEDSASNKKLEKKDMIGMQEQVFLWKIIELHDKYVAYVTQCLHVDLWIS
ncbi:cullin-1-like [Miscanthus floridulus]|uniref:cullin-1-like n=1 Tax=Miscanthus floridulus TaxID=154761 RepID=UPI003459C644